jgi:hypothetical protein
MFSRAFGVRPSVALLVVLSAGVACGVAERADAQAGCFALSSLGAAGATRTTPSSVLVGAVFASTWWDPDGSGPLAEWLVVGGAFDFMDGVPARNVAAWDGTQWRALGAGLGVPQLPTQTTIEALTVFEGRLYAGGRIAVNNPSATTGVWSFDGANWERVGSGIALNTTLNSVLTLQEFEGELYAGGAFQIGTAFSQSSIAKLVNGDWQPAGFLPSASTSPRVRDLHVHNGQLFAAGSFSLAQPGGGAAVGLLRRVNGVWEPVGSPGILPGVADVTTLRSEGSDLLVGGLFVLTGSAQPLARVARFDGTTIVSVTLGAPELANANVSGLGRISGDLWVTGTRQLNLLRSENGVLVPRGEGVTQPQTNEQRWTVVIGESDGTRANVPAGLILGGVTAQTETTTTVGQQTWRWLNGLSVFDGTRHTPITRSPDRLVNDLVEYQGEMVAVGTFLSAGGKKMNRIGTFDGQQWSPLDDGRGLNNRGLTAVVWGNNLVVGGIFTEAGGAAAQRVAMWNGSAWEPLGSIPEDAVVNLVDWNGTLLAVCSNGVTRVTDNAPWVLRRWTGSTWELFGGSEANAANIVVTPLGAELYGARTGAPAIRWTGTAWEALPTAAFGEQVFVNGTSRGRLAGSGSDGTRYVLENGAWRAVSTDGVPVGFVGVGGFVDEGVRLSVGNQSSQFPAANWFAGGGVYALPSAQVTHRSASVTGLTYTAALRYAGRTYLAGSLGGFQTLVNGQPSATPAFSMVELSGPGNVPTFEATQSAVVRTLPGEDVTLAVTVRDNPSGTRSWRRNNIAISDGVQADGSVVEGATTDTLVVRNVAYTPQAQLYRLVVQGSSTCATQWLGTQFSVRVGRECDSVDFNNDGMFPDDADLVEFLAVLAGQSCEACNDIDFDNDGLFPNDEDLLAFLRALAGEAC